MRLITSEDLPAVTGGVQARDAQNWRSRGILDDAFGRRQGRGSPVLYDKAEAAFLAVFHRLAGSRPSLDDVAFEARAIWQDVIAWSQAGGGDALYRVTATGMRVQHSLMIRVPLDDDGRPRSGQVCHSNGERQLLAVADAVAAAGAELAKHDERLIVFDALNLSMLISEVAHRFDQAARAVDDDQAAPTARRDVA